MMKIAEIIIGKAKEICGGEREISFASNFEDLELDPEEAVDILAETADFFGFPRLDRDDALFLAESGDIETAAKMLAGSQL